VGRTDILKEFIRLSIDDPVKLAGLLGAIKAPTHESQQLEDIQRQLVLIHSWWKSSASFCLFRDS